MSTQAGDKRENREAIPDPLRIHHLFPNGVICSSIIEERANAPLLLSALRRYPKFRSVVALSAARLPVLDLMLLHCWSPNAEKSVCSFLTRHNIDRVLIRSESRGGKLASPSRQGVRVDKIASVASDLLAERSGTIVGIQAAGNIYRNIYNLNLMIDPWEPVRVLIEVSGPGFTARDLNRFGVVHERLEVPSYAIGLSDSLVRRTYVVPVETYQLERRAKINSLGEATAGQENGLVLSYHQYPEIPISFLQTIWPELASIKMIIDWLGLSEVGAIVSLSFILHLDGYARHFYWDVHPMR